MDGEQTDQAAETGGQPADRVPEGWVRLELLGHRTRIGRISECQVAGQPMLRMAYPGPGGTDQIEWYPPHSVYAITRMTEALARAALAPFPTPRSMLGDYSEAEDQEDDESIQVVGPLETPY